MTTQAKQVTLPRNQVGIAKAGTAYSGQKGSDLRNQYENFVEETARLVRSRGDASAILRTLASQEGMMSTAVYAVTQIANAGYTVIGYDNDTGQPSVEATYIAQRVLAMLDVFHDYTTGFNSKPSIAAVVETQLREVALTGGCAQELVLDKYRLPESITPVAYDSLTKKANGKGGYYPQQKVSSGNPVDLNIANFFVAESNKEANSAYAFSMFRAGLASSFMLQEFIEDTRRGVRKTGHSRLVAKIIAEQVMAAAPAEVQADPKKLAKWLAGVKKEVEVSLQSIEPEDAVVSFDSVEFSVEDVGGSKSDYAPLLKLLANITGSSMKTPSSISGLRADGSQSLSNAETLTYLKIAKSLCTPIEEVMSRTLTLAVRLMGCEGYVKWKMNEIDLRPDSELEAYKTAKQNRILEQLSLGLISDVTAYVQLSLPVHMSIKQLSGTGFYETKNSTPEPDRKDAMGKDLNPGTPTSAGGKDND